MSVSLPNTSALPGHDTSEHEKDIESGGFRGDLSEHYMCFSAVNILVVTLADSTVSLLSHLKHSLLVSDTFEGMFIFTHNRLRVL